ncbi:MFS transporter OS=Streptomyces tendae OX=1932 GN=GUR47_29520 PE=4 SV=1 [Streptomyces tendae]
MPNTLGLLRSVFPPKFGMAVGIWAMVSAVATALGPIVGGLLVEHVDWESVFYIDAPIGVAAIVFGALASRRAATPRAASASTYPASSCSPSVCWPQVFGVVKGETWGWTSASTLGAVNARPGPPGRVQAGTRPAWSTRCCRCACSAAAR